MVERAIYGDFQTPRALADSFVEAVGRRCPSPAIVVEPTVGRGAILAAALSRFPSARGLGVDRNPSHLRDAERALGADLARVTLVEGDMFAFDYSSSVGSMDGPIAILGNPPWITSAAMPALGGSNLPRRSNAGRMRGIDAKTGRANFDVAEWLLLELARTFAGRDVTVAMLVKTQVARRFVRSADAMALPIADAWIAAIDAMGWFGAAVDACAFGFRLDATSTSRDVACFDSLEAGRPSRLLGSRSGVLFSDVSSTELVDLIAEIPNGAFRSGVKHDAADVFELRRDEAGLRNGYGELVDVESSVRFPFVKGGDLGRVAPKVRELVLPQRSLGEDTERLAVDAPRAFAYLERHGPRLAARRSSIYVGRPRFSVFGIGEYSFAPYKVAVFGLAKVPRFEVLAPRDERPVLVDDTAYFVPCADRAEAESLCACLGTPIAGRLFEALVFPDSKRPITKELLSRIDLGRLARRAAMLGQLSSEDATRVETLATSLVGAGQVSKVSPSQHSA